MPKKGHYKHYGRATCGNRECPRPERRFDLTAGQYLKLKQGILVRPRIYCSKACTVIARKQAHACPMELTCPTCQKPFPRDVYARARWTHGLKTPCCPACRPQQRRPRKDTGEFVAQPKEVRTPKQIARWIVAELVQQDIVAVIHAAGGD